MRGAGYLTAMGAVVSPLMASVKVPQRGKMPLRAPADGSVLTATAAAEAVTGGTSPAASPKVAKNTLVKGTLGSGEGSAQNVAALLGLAMVTGP